MSKPISIGIIGHLTHIVRQSTHVSTFGILHPDKATWQRPFALKGLDATLNEQHLKRHSLVLLFRLSLIWSHIEAKHHAVGCHSWMRITVMIFESFLIFHLAFSIDDAKIMFFMVFLRNFYIKPLFFSTFQND